MRELTDDQKLRLYSKPEISEEDQINNAINGYSRIIQEANNYLENIDSIPEKELRVEFNHIGINDKTTIIGMYKVLIGHWKQELISAKKELASFKGEEYIEEDEEPDNIEPKKKRFNFFQFVDNILSRVPKVVETIDTIKGKK